MAGEVSFNEFQMCREDSHRQLREIKEHMKAQDDNLDDLKELLIQMTEFVRLQRETNERTEKRLQALESNNKTSSNQFWQTKWFEWVIKGLVTLAVLITMAAVARDLMVEVLTKVLESGIMP